MTVPFSEVELDIAGRRADTDLDARAWLGEVAGPQVAHAARDEPCIAAVADPHAAAMGGVDAGGFGDAEQRRTTIAVRLGAARQEAHAPTTVVRGHRSERGGEA